MSKRKRYRDDLDLAIDGYSRVWEICTANMRAFHRCRKLVKSGRVGDAKSYAFGALFRLGNKAHKVMHRGLA